MSKVTLEIVGIYFKKKITLPKKSKALTVQNIMDLAIKEYGNATVQGGLDYMTEGITNPMDVIRHNFEGGQTRSGKTRMAGLYELREQRIKGDPRVQAWQYYVIDSKNNRVSATYPGEGFDSFIEAEFEFDNKWKLIWRMVTILKEPNSRIATV